MKRLVFFLLGAVFARAADFVPSAHYRVENIATPPGLSAEIGGLAFRPDGKLAACFHRGEVYIYDPATQQWRLFAHGLHDPLGLLAPTNDEVIVMQRPELTRLRDTDGDGVADRYETICDDFGLTGNYHEFASGPLAAPDGGWFVALNVASSDAGVRHEMRGEYRERERGRAGRMFSAVPWRGWVMKIAPDGKATPWASGFRSPNGLGSDARGRLFVPDNQGDWIGSSALYHVEKGQFYGHPAALAWKPGETRAPLQIPIEELDKARTRASVVFPQNLLANSPTQPLADTTAGKFGPFAGQLLIGEMNHARLLRVALEEVDGQLQGMAVPLLEGAGLNKGNHRLAFAPDGSLWVGQTDHGGAGDKGLQRISWTGAVPLDVRAMRLTATGFEFTFTRPLAVAGGGHAAAFRAQRYYYEYHAADGSPQMDVQTIEPKSVALSEDRTRVTVEFGPLVAWRLYQFDLQALRGEDGAAVANPVVVYTLNHLLKDTPPPPPGASATETALPSPKTPTPPAATPAKSKSTTPTPPKKPVASPSPTPKKAAAKTSPTPTPTPAKKAAAKASPTPTPKPAKSKATPTPKPKR